MKTMKSYAKPAMDTMQKSNIQDGTVIHVGYGDDVTTIGENVTIGHNCTIHGCEIASNTLIGMGAIILNGAKIGEGSIVGAGALIKKFYCARTKIGRWSARKNSS